MPTFLNLEGFKFFFYANDHPPPHIHVLKSGGWAKIEIDSLNVLHSTLKVGDLKKALEILTDYQSEFLEKWYEWFCR